MTTMEVVFSKVGIVPKKERGKSWPRARGPAATRVDVACGKAVGFLRKDQANNPTAVTNMKGGE